MNQATPAKLSDERLESNRLLASRERKGFPDSQNRWLVACEELFSHIDALTADLAAKDAEIERLKQQLASLAEPKDAEALVKIFLEEAATTNIRIYSFENLPTKHLAALSAGMSSVATHIRAESAKQIADLTAKLEEREAYIQSKECEYKCMYCGERWSSEDRDDGRRLSLEHNDRCDKNPRRQVEADRDQWKQRAEAAENKDTGIYCGHCHEKVGSFAGMKIHMEACRIHPFAKLKSAHDSLAAELATAQQALAAKTGELQRLRAAINECDSDAESLMDWLNGMADPFSDGVKEWIRDNPERMVFLACRWLARLQSAALATPAAAEPDADHCGDANKKPDTPEPPAFVCPACGGTEFVQGESTRDGIFCDSEKCNWFGTWADVAEARAAKTGTKTVTVTASSHDGCIYLVREDNGDAGWVYDYCAYATRELAATSARGKSVPTEVECFIPKSANDAQRQRADAAEARGKAGEEMKGVGKEVVTLAWPPIFGYRCPDCGDSARWHPSKRGVWGCFKCQSISDPSSRWYARGDDSFAVDELRQQLSSASEQLDAERQRANDLQRRLNEAEAGAAGLRAALSHARLLAEDTDLEQFVVPKIDEALATTAGAATAERLRRLEGVAKAAVAFRDGRGTWNVVLDELAALDQTQAEPKPRSE